jgi:hypothetical protein
MGQGFSTDLGPQSGAGLQAPEPGTPSAGRGRWRKGLRSGYYQAEKSLYGAVPCLTRSCPDRPGRAREATFA